MSPGRRSFSLPRSDGTMQKVHVLLQPTEIDTHAEYGDSRRAGSREGNVVSVSSNSACASCRSRARSSSFGRAPMLCVPYTTSTQGARCVIWVRSICARQPPTAICMPWCAFFTGSRWPRLPYSRSAAFSLTAHVLNTMRSGVSPRAAFS